MVLTISIEDDSISMRWVELKSTAGFDSDETFCGYLLDQELIRRREIKTEIGRTVVKVEVNESLETSENIDFSNDELPISVDIMDLNVDLSGSADDIIRKRRRCKSISTHYAGDSYSGDGSEKSSELVDRGRTTRRKRLKNGTKCAKAHKNRSDLLGASQKEYPCEDCGKVLKRLFLLRKHQQTQHTGHRSHCCSTCGKYFYTGEALSMHASLHSDELTGVQCEVCQEKFLFATSLKIHKMSTHKNSTNAKSKISGEKEIVYGTKAGDRGPVLCDLCGNKFRCFFVMNEHRNVVHLGIKNFECPYCNRKFGIKKNMKEHVIQVHEGGLEKKFVCEECGQRFWRMKRLQIHQKRHSLPERSLVCQFCSKKLKSWKCYRQHLKLHDNSIHPCNMCQKSFKCSKYLTDHKRTEHGCIRTICPTNRRRGEIRHINT